MNINIKDGSSNHSSFFCPDILLYCINLNKLNYTLNLRTYRNEQCVEVSECWTQESLLCKPFGSSPLECSFSVSEQNYQDFFESGKVVSPEPFLVDLVQEHDQLLWHVAACFVLEHLLVLIDQFVNQRCVVCFVVKMFQQRFQTEVSQSQRLDVVLCKRVITSKQNFSNSVFSSRGCSFGKHSTFWKLRFFIRVQFMISSMLCLCSKT